jgi:hypothetical protein
VIARSTREGDVCRGSVIARSTLDTEDLGGPVIARSTPEADDRRGLVIARARLGAGTDEADDLRIGDDFGDRLLFLLLFFFFFFSRDRSCPASSSAGPCEGGPPRLKTTSWSALLSCL